MLMVSLEIMFFFFYRIFKLPVFQNIGIHIQQKCLIAKIINSFSFNQSSSEPAKGAVFYSTVRAYGLGFGLVEFPGKVPEMKWHGCRTVGAGEQGGGVTALGSAPDNHQLPHSGHHHQHLLKKHCFFFFQPPSNKINSVQLSCLLGRLHLQIILTTFPGSHTTTHSLPQSHTPTPISSWYNSRKPNLAKPKSVSPSYAIKPFSF